MKSWVSWQCCACRQFHFSCSKTRHHFTRNATQSCTQFMFTVGKMYYFQKITCNSLGKFYSERCWLINDTLTVMTSDTDLRTQSQYWHCDRKRGWQERERGQCVQSMTVVCIPLGNLFSFPLLPFFSSFLFSIIDATVFLDFCESSNVRIFLEKEQNSEKFSNKLKLFIYNNLHAC